MIAPALAPFATLFEYNEESVKETFEEVIISLRSESYKPLEIESFKEIVSSVDDRDTIQISYIIGEGTSVDFSSGGDALAFIKDYDRRNSIREQEKITIEIKIIKDVVNGVSSVYSYSNLISFLEGLSIQALFSEFNRLLKINKYLIFENQSTEPTSSSKSIWFANKGFSGRPEIIDRSVALNKAKTSCHYNFLADFVVLPDDFMFTIKDCANLATLFNRLTITASVVFLYDISVLTGSTLSYKLNGYKSITGEVDLNKLNADPKDQYFKIYNWVYESGNFNDKIGLARNIISLHLETKDSIELKGDPFQSIQSSYKVYEKQNIKQYVEIRNKISDQLLSFHDRANKIIETFAGGFQKSALALITFYTSAIVIKLLNKDELIGVFTLDAAILSTGFIFCSAGYYWVSKWEVDAQKERFKNNYADIKKRYTDLLDEQDIERILNNDHEFKSDLKFMVSKGRKFAFLWFYFLVVLFIITWLLYFIYNPVLFIKIGHWFQASCSRSC